MMCDIDIKWNECIQIAEHEIENKSYEEVVDLMSKMLYNKMNKKVNFENIKSYVQDMIQEL